MLVGQQSVFTNIFFHHESVVAAGYAVAKMTTKRSKPFSDGKFLNGCFFRVADFMCPEKGELFEQISLSKQTIACRIKDSAVFVMKSLVSKAGDFAFYSLALDESTDIKDIAQVAIFVCGVDKSFGVNEKLACVVPLKGTTKGSYILKAVMATLNRLQLNLNDMSGVTTDEAPSICGSRQGLVKLLQNVASKAGNNSVIQFHCVIHQENLCAKLLKMDNVMLLLQKQSILSVLKVCAIGDFKIYYAARKQILKIYHTTAKYVKLKDDIQLFKADKGNPIFEFVDAEWICDFAFLVDITSHLNELNSRLQRKGQLINCMFDHVKAFLVKLSL